MDIALKTCITIQQWLLKMLEANRREFWGASANHKIGMSSPKANTDVPFFFPPLNIPVWKKWGHNSVCYSTYLNVAGVQIQPFGLFTRTNCQDESHQLPSLRNCDGTQSNGQAVKLNLKLTGLHQLIFVLVSHFDRLVIHPHTHLYT